MNTIYTQDLAKDYRIELRQLGLTLDKEDNNTVCATPNAHVNTKIIEICCQLQRKVNELEIELMDCVRTHACDQMHGIE